MIRLLNPKKLRRRLARGFTLVEMLVATALVVLMMTLFAQIFQTSGNLVSDIKSNGELDQSVRTLTILLRGDIKQRTFVDVVPFVAGQDTTSDQVPGYNETTGKGYDADFRRGFFSISENSPDDPTDDVLHLTISTSSPLSRGLDGSLSLPYSGRTRLLRSLVTLPANNPANPDAYLQAHPDQPEFDDGQLEVNNTGSSHYAEVCWFLRHGKLYRRILLIRDPYHRGENDTQPVSEAYDTPDPPPDPPDPTVPLDPAEELIPTFYDPDGDGAADNFWRDFDYAAYWEPAAGGGEFKFHAVPDALDNLSNSSGAANLLNLPRSLGIPFLRYGSSVNRAQAGSPLRIIGPREYIGTSFIGRYTVQESADRDFGYPGSFSNATDPFNSKTGGPSAGPSLSLNNRGIVSPYDNETARRGEDLVMSNVHEFDIQVWDEVLAAFVDLGHSQTNAAGTPGWFHQGRNENPNGDFENRFDTWHPHTDMPASPPYAPYGDPTAANGLAARNGVQSKGLGADEEVWLKAIRIKIRFFDVAGDQMRDLTFTFRLNRENFSN